MEGDRDFGSPEAEVSIEEIASEEAADELEFFNLATEHGEPEVDDLEGEEGELANSLELLVLLCHDCDVVEGAYGEATKLKKVDLEVEHDRLEDKIGEDCLEDLSSCIRSHGKVVRYKSRGELHDK